MKNAVRVLSSNCSVLARAPVGAKFPGREPATLAGSRTRLQHEKVTFKERQDRLQVEPWNVSSEETWTVRFIQPPISRIRITEARRDGWNGWNQGQGLKHGLCLPHVLCVADSKDRRQTPLGFHFFKSRPSGNGPRPRAHSIVGKILSTVPARNNRELSFVLVLLKLSLHIVSRLSKQFTRNGRKEKKKSGSGR